MKYTVGVSTGIVCDTSTCKDVGGMYDIICEHVSVLVRTCMCASGSGV